MREPQGIYVQLAVSKVHAHGEAGMPRYFGGPHVECSEVAARYRKHAR
jgi:hypothetical protein